MTGPRQPPAADDHGHTGLVGDVADLLAGLEHVHHITGWDSTPATLYLVTRDVTGVLTPWPSRLGLLGHPPMVELQVLADAMGTENARTMYAERMPADAAPIAWLLVAETWRHAAADDETDDELRTRLRGRALADVVGSVEDRIAAGVVGSHRLLRERVRGEPPRWASDPGGSMFESLTKLQAAGRSLLTAGGGTS